MCGKAFDVGRTSHAHWGVDKACLFAVYMGLFFQKRFARGVLCWKETLRFAGLSSIYSYLKQAGLFDNILKFHLLDFHVVLQFFLPWQKKKSLLPHRPTPPPNVVWWSIEVLARSLRHSYADKKRQFLGGAHLKTFLLPLPFYFFWCFLNSLPLLLQSKSFGSDAKRWCQAFVSITTTGKRH